MIAGYRDAEALMPALFVDPGSLRSELHARSLHDQWPMAIGGHTESWAEIATVFALIEPVSASAASSAPDQTLETVTHRLTMRWRSGVASGMRFARAGPDLRHRDGARSGRYRPLSCLPREGDRLMKLARCN